MTATTMTVTAIMAATTRDHAGSRRKRTVATSHDDRVTFKASHKREVITGFTTLIFKDIEESLGTFSGDGAQNIMMANIILEETADMWTDAQKMIYAKAVARIRKTICKFPVSLTNMEGFKECFNRRVCQNDEQQAGA